MSAVLLVAMGFGLSGCPTVNALMGDAPFNGVYCSENFDLAGCHDREPEISRGVTNTVTPNPAPSQPTGPTNPANPT